MSVRKILSVRKKQRPSRYIPASSKNDFATITNSFGSQAEAITLHSGI